MPDGTYYYSLFASVTSLVEANMPDGTYYYSLFASDAEGNDSTAGTASVTVNTYVAPTTPMVSGGGGGSFFLLPSTFNTIPFSFPGSNEPTKNVPLLTPLASSLNLNPIITSIPLPVSPAAPSTAASVFKRILRPGDRGNDVKALQIFLNTHGFIVAKNGQGSTGHESIFYGPATAKAVKKFQEAHAEEILKPQNLEKGTGVFGVKMRDLINTIQ
jgi:hypothetical protein